MNSLGEDSGQSQWQKIDQLCDRFESEKRAGKNPQIAEYLNETESSHEREQLLRELLQLDIELGADLGETATLEKYLEQLPNDDQLVRTNYERHQTRANRRSSTGTVEPQLTPGQTFGSYTIENKIGAGGMGHVYHARHVTMDRDVALKVLTPKLMDSPDAVARFHREIKAAAKLQHPNIVTAFDAGEQDGLHFLVMEYVDGRDLSSYVKSKGPLSLKQAIKCTIQAAKGLAYAHEQNIIHRDIKPANLLVDRKGTVKVLDMGLARFEIESENHELTELTGTGMVMGTIDYMAPEQSLDTRTADARSDIYSLGCTFWYLLTGNSVYGGDTVMKKLLAHREEEIPSLRQLSTKIPESVDQVFQKMVAKDKDDRYQSMNELVSALQNSLKKRGPSDSSSDLSMAADPKLASFLKDLDAPKATSPNMEYEESISHTAAEQATVIGPVSESSSSQKHPPSSLPIGKFPKWVYGVAAGVVALIVAALVIPGDVDPPKPQPRNDTVVSSENLPTEPVLEGAEWGKLGESPDVREEATVNHALKFDGVDDLVIVKPWTHPVTEPITYEATVFYDPPDGEPSQGQMLVTPHGSLLVGPAERPLMLLWHALESRAVVTLADSEPMPTKRKSQLAASWDGETYRLFVDGRLVDEAPLTKFPSDKLQNWFAIGGHLSRTGSSGSLCFPGIIDEVRISNTARYTDDYNPVDRLETDEHTLALYHFDEGSGKVLKDHSDNEHHGTIQGTEWVRVDSDLDVIEDDLSEADSDPWAAEREVAE